MPESINDTFLIFRKIENENNNLLKIYPFNMTGRNVADDNAFNEMSTDEQLDENTKPLYSYQCSDCKRLEKSSFRDVIKCTGCGCRIFNKLRKDEFTQYECR